MNPILDVVLIPKPETSTESVIDVAIEPRPAPRTNPYYTYADELHPNATCADCGIDYSKADDDPTPCCDGCSDRRDRWADAFAIRQMAKAVLSIDLTKVDDVA